MRFQGAGALITGMLLAASLTAHAIPRPPARPSAEVIPLSGEHRMRINSEDWVHLRAKFKNSSHAKDVFQSRLDPQLVLTMTTQTGRPLTGKGGDFSAEAEAKWMCDQVGRILRLSPEPGNEFRSDTGPLTRAGAYACRVESRGPKRAYLQYMVFSGLTGKTIKGRQAPYYIHTLSAEFDGEDAPAKLEKARIQAERLLLSFEKK